MIRFRILGGLDLRDRDGRELREVLAQPRRLGLLAYLAVSSRHGFVRRDQTLALFWPEHDEERARASLNRAIYYLRHSLGDGVLVSRGVDEIGLSADHFWCDAGALETAVLEGRYEEALDLYRGELLEAFFVSNAAGFERWVDEERRRFAGLTLRAAWSLADAADSDGNHVLAAQWCRWAADRSPLDEAAAQRLMAALDRAGDRAGAVLAYERFARRIAGDLDLTPSPETRALLEAIRLRSASNGQSHSGSDRVGLTGNGELAAAAHPSSDEAGPAHDPISEPTEALSSTARESRPSAREPVPIRRRERVVRRAALALVVTGAVAACTALVLRGRDHPLDSRRIAVTSLPSSPGDRTLDSLTERGNGAIRDALSRTGLVAAVVQSPIEIGGIGRTLGDPGIRALGARMGAGSVVVTSIRREGDTLYFGAQIIETLGGRVRWVVPAARAAASLPGPAVNELVQRVSGAIAALGDRRFESWLPAATSPPTLAAYQEFDRGMDLRLRNRPAESVPLFERAAALDPTFTWAALEAAVSHMAAGDRTGADSIVNILNATRNDLAPVERHFLDWMLALQDEDWTRSYTALERAAQIVPPRFLYLLAENARWLNRPRRSVQLLEQLGPDGPLGGFGYWYLMSDSYHTLGDHTRELDFARRGRQRQPERLTGLIVEARARAALGDVSGATALVDTALSFPRGGRDTPGTMMLQTAEELRAHGHEGASAELLARAIAWFQTRPPSEAADLTTRTQFAQAAYDAGRWTLADSLFRRLLVDDREGAAEYRAKLGAIAAHRGDTAAARRFLVILQELTRSVNRPREDAMRGQARILAVLGDRREALRLLRDALGGQGQDLHTDADFESMAADPEYRLFVRPKG